MSGLPPINEDLRELIALFRSHRVEFLVVGAHALAYYGHPRFTQDLDLFVRPSAENGVRIQAALRAFGVDLTDAARDNFVATARGMMVIGNPPHQVDLLNFLDGVEFDAAWANQNAGQIGDVEVPFLSLDDYVTTKRATGRAKDLDDLNRLREARRDYIPY